MISIYDNQETPHKVSKYIQRFISRYTDISLVLGGAGGERSEPLAHFYNFNNYLLSGSQSDPLQNYISHHSY
jgi:hypothetical protein